jgi:predicted TIM-barrel fold metal-dependent hydrolase
LYAAEVNGKQQAESEPDPKTNGGYNRPMTRAAVAGAAAILAAIVAHAQTPTVPLVAYIDSIKAIDNHTHVVAPDAEHDAGYDALPCDALPPGSALPTANVRFGPDVLGAWRALYGFSGTAGDDRQVALARRAQASVRQRQASEYFKWVLDQARIDVVLANRITMAPELGRPRFRWVPYDDALLFPLDNKAEKAATPDRRVFYEREEQLLKSYFQQAGITALPQSLDRYLEFIVNILTRQRNEGAVAIKFEAAYLRSLDFAPSRREEAAVVFERYRGGGTPSATEYKVLQDYLFRDVAEQAGRLGLAVQIHTGTGCGEYFDARGGDPMLLTSAVNDAALRSTTFVLLHGGSPVERTITALIAKPNVYADTSVLELVWSPPELARILRPWLETMPEHVLFGTDAGPWGPGYGWEESTWLGSRQARRALTIALTQMINDRVITTARARTIANRVLRENAAELYHLGR